MKTAAWWHKGTVVYQMLDLDAPTRSIHCYTAALFQVALRLRNAPARVAWEA